MKVTVKTKGNFRKTEKLLKKIRSGDYIPSLDRFGQIGVDALQTATPARSGLTASSWGYEIEKDETGIKIQWVNRNVNDGANVAILIQYGHGTGTGGYVQGIDYINPALKPIFDAIADEAWKEVRKA